MALIEAFKKIKNKSLPVEIYSDSKYVVDAIKNGWINKWQSNRFAKTKNPDLWLEFLKASKGIDYKIHWIKGHNNHPENEECDRLAIKATQTNPQYIDTGYELSSNNKNDTLF